MEKLLEKMIIELNVLRIKIQKNVATEKQKIEFEMITEFLKKHDSLC